MPQSHSSASRDLILDAVDSSDGITRAEVAKQTGLSSSTVSNIVRDLISEGLIDEHSGPSGGGRPVQILQATTRHGPVWVAEIGTAHARIGVVDRPGQLDTTDEILVSVAEGPKQVITMITRALVSLSEITGRPTTPAALALALPGPVDTTDCCVVGAARMSGWNNVDLRPLVDDGVRLIIDNDAHAGAIGEVSARPDGERPSHALYIKAGTGIGGAMIIGDSLYTGHSGLAGDITHNPLKQAADTPCTCGRTGCLETVASGAGIIRALKEQGTGVDGIADLVNLTKQGHPAATTLVRNAGNCVGEVLAPIVTFLNPEEVIIGGALSNVDAFNAAVRSELYARCLPVVSSEVKIGASRTGADAALYGMAQEAYRQLTGAH